MTKPHFQFEHTYADLSESLYAEQKPTPVSAPALRAYNHDLATRLGLPELSTGDATAYFSGNELPEGAKPIAQAYAGHQFGHWNPQLGDGRAILLGEVVDPDGTRFDIQLKGAGPTPWSRGGDGRAWIGPVLREYLLSRFMHSVDVPTTQALAFVETGEQVIREQVLPGAVLTRVAESHIRVGTFEYFSVRGDLESLQKLRDHVIARHYPGVTSSAELLEAATMRQARLVAQWMGLGFIHGVMNTDNCHVAGITIDYGPCAFMEAYEPNKVFSSIDRNGRYAYSNQPHIARWNMAVFATALLALEEDKDKATEEFTAIVKDFDRHFQWHWAKVFNHKLGLPFESGDEHIHQFLQMMADTGANFTQCFSLYAEGRVAELLGEHPLWSSWWERVMALGGDLESSTNPAFIPRNHLIERAIQDAVNGDYELFERLNTACASPLSTFDDSLIRVPKPDEEVSQTFCGT